MFRKMLVTNLLAAAVLLIAANSWAMVTAGIADGALDYTVSHETLEAVNELALGYTDADGDGIINRYDSCPEDASNLCNEEEIKTGGETGGEPTDEDADGDGFIDYDDNCPDDPNPDQLDSDDDGVGDACDFDMNLDDQTPVSYSDEAGGCTIASANGAMNPLGILLIAAGLLQAIAIRRK